MSILERIDKQERRVECMELSEDELEAIQKARGFLYTVATVGCGIGAMAGYIMSMGKHSSRMTKLLVPAGSGVAGLSLGMAFGVQTGMEKLHQLTSPLGEELRGLEELRTRLRKRGTSEPLFIGDAAEAEGDRLSRIFNARAKPPRQASQDPHSAKELDHQ